MSGGFQVQSRPQRFFGVTKRSTGVIPWGASPKTRTYVTLDSMFHSKLQVYLDRYDDI